jgi:isopentenyl-diphosphate delta-isomerase
LTEVILVNEKDEPVGTIEKLAAHQQALLHRAISVFIFNKKNEILLQQRNKKKYHSGGLWANACCSHPAPGEAVEAAAARRLKEELGFSTPLKKAFDFIYKATFHNGLTENEFDHVFIGTYDGDIQPDKEEVMDYCFMSISDIKNTIASHPEKYAEWFKIALPKIEAYLLGQNKT